MMNKMIVANLVHRPLRSLISIVAIALEVTLILLIVGLSVGMLNDSRQRQAGIGADVIVLPPGFVVHGRHHRCADVDQDRRHSGASCPTSSRGSPVIWQLTTAGTLEVIYGIDLKSFEALVGPSIICRAALSRDRTIVLVDDYLRPAASRESGRHDGDSQPSFPGGRNRGARPRSAQVSCR